MKNEGFKRIKNFYLFVFAVAMVLIFLCGCLTVYERGEYALYYEKYPTVSVERSRDSDCLCIDDEEVYTFNKISNYRRIHKILMYTPLSPVLLIFEAVSP